MMNQKLGLLLFVFITIISACKKEEVVTEPIEIIQLPEIMRGLINQPQLYWVYKRNDGRIGGTSRGNYLRPNPGFKSIHLPMLKAMPNIGNLKTMLDTYK